MDNAYAVILRNCGREKERGRQREKSKSNVSFQIFSTVKTTVTMRHRQVEENVLALLHIVQSVLMPKTIFSFDRNGKTGQ